MEYAATVLNHSAAHQEMEPEADSPLIAKLTCSLAESTAKVLAKRGSRYEALTGRLESEEEFNCNYGVAENFEGLFGGTEIEFVATDTAGQVRVFWHRSHRFFVGSLFQPERKALLGELHPLVYAFIEQTCH
jgi:CTP synthase (UTP-ammonia lyase)